VSGMLIPVSDTDEATAEGMAKAISELIDSDARTAEMGKAGQASAAIHFSLDSFGHALVRITNELLVSKCNQPPALIKLISKETLAVAVTVAAAWHHCSYVVAMMVTVALVLFLAGFWHLQSMFE
jgi:hypothetical protein